MAKTARGQTSTQSPQLLHRETSSWSVIGSSM
jgi:hypothetical protein